MHCLATFLKIQRIDRFIFTPYKVDKNVNSGKKMYLMHFWQNGNKVERGINNERFSVRRGDFISEKSLLGVRIQESI